MKLDNEKLRYDLVDDEAEAEFVAVLSYGAIKYEPHNWRLLPDAKERYFSAARRHMRALRGGESLDPESGLHHAACAKACLHYILALDLEEMGLNATIDQRFAESREIAWKIRASRTE